MDIPDRVKKLIETFDNNLDAYKKGLYNETQVRREFIDPFFEELGWDVSNRQGYAEAYKDVIHEEAIKVGGVINAPDNRDATPPDRFDRRENRSTRV
jgi:hypothetical protein